MKKVTILAVLTALVAFSGCKKDDDKDSTPKDCETNNYGVLLVNFGSTVERHSILVTIPGSNKIREKISPIGKSSDTVHLAPNNYPLNISSLDKDGHATDQKSTSASITKCNDTHLTVDF